MAAFLACQRPLVQRLRGGRTETSDLIQEIVDVIVARGIFICLIKKCSLKSWILLRFMVLASFILVRPFM